MDETQPTVPYGYCHCGCGQRTNLAPRDDLRFGHVEGQPVRYVLGHSTRQERPYTVEERGHRTPCWICQRWRNKDGYARLCDGTGKGRPAHVVMWERVNGPVPDGLQLDHLCSVRECINPDHLEPVTATENVRRSRATRLTIEEAREIRDLLKHGWVQTDIAAAYGISQPMVAAIKSGRYWRED